MTLHRVAFTVLLSLGVLHAVALAVPKKDVMEVISVSGEDAVLKCAATHKPGVQYTAVVWYKVRDPPLSRLNGLVIKDLPDGKVQWYSGADRQVELLSESTDIYLSNVTCNDSGVYVCHLAAPVGEQNQEGQVLLSLIDCPDKSTENPTKDAYVIIASAVLMFAFIMSITSCVCLKSTHKDRNKTITKEASLDAPLQLPSKDDLNLIRTLGPKASPPKYNWA